VLNFILDLFPFYVYKHSEAFCEINVGDTFMDGAITYRLLYRDCAKIQVVRYNWWTKLWWGGTIR
jgi:hypothetical protein